MSSLQAVTFKPRQAAETTPKQAAEIILGPIGKITSLPAIKITPRLAGISHPCQQQKTLALSMPPSPDRKEVGPGV